jgi:hypothetical protein
MTGPYPLPKRVLHTVSVSASSFNFQYTLFSLRTSSSAYVFFLVSLPFYRSLHLSFNAVYHKAVTTPDVSNQLASLLFTARSTLFSPLACVTLLRFSQDRSSRSSTPSPAPHFKTFWFTYWSVQVSAPYKVTFLMWHFTSFFLKNIT